MRMFHVIPHISDGIPMIGDTIVQVSPCAYKTHSLLDAIYELAQYQFETEDFDSGIRMGIE